MNPDTSSIRVLVVDDSRPVLYLLERMLTDQFELASANNGNMALELYESFRPHIIILDLWMPGQNGMDIITTIRRDYGDQQTLILVLTAEETAEIKAQALNNGANDFVAKPFNRTELMARLGVSARQVQLTRSLHEAHHRIQREIDLIARMQRGMLPDDSLAGHTLPCGHVETLYRPSQLASGDYYDFFPLDEHRLRVCVADVSGHGARAAFLMAVVRTLFRASKDSGDNLSQVMRQTNEHLQSMDLKMGDFVTMFAADIDFTSNTMNYINAGHCPGLLCSASSVRCELDPTGPLLGIMDHEYMAHSEDLPKGFGLLLYTDGLFEWRTESGEIFGLENFLDVSMQTLDFQKPFLGRLLEGLTLQRKDSGDFCDDLTALWVQWKPHD